ncbi:MAG: hypothetical protein GWO00_04925, partial [Gemmatimonadetes bacterium]|nr:hypothetical protein [Gemmatimonadota bacterium]NIT86277.1 hypothetical protein [Gemmatimonadota bacterium]NIU30110.1 hypothetical protein [Gemmatimonadota bacterium]NIW63183.1 hypothetical protein [Gemmatimonadota bacterium]
MSYDLPYEVSQRVTQDVTRAVVDDLARETGVTVTREGYGPGGYLDYPVVPSGQIKVRGVPDAVGNFIDSIGYL